VQREIVEMTVAGAVAAEQVFRNAVAKHYLLLRKLLALS